MGAPPQLFSDSDSGEDNSKDIAINQEYARRFEHNKRREDLQRFADLKSRGEVDSSSEDDDEYEEEEAVGSSRTDLQFFDALVKIRRKDPVIHLKDAKFYSSSSEDDGDDLQGRKSKVDSEKAKPLYIKDVTARHLLENGPEFEDPDPIIESQAKVYSKEQEENRQRFLDAAEDAEIDTEDGGDFFKEKKKKRGDVDALEGGEEEEKIRKKMDELWGKDANMDENELFLKDFFQQKMWVGKEEAAGDAEELSVDEDEDELEKQEKYEAEYNFRFEEGAGDRVLGHSRVVEGSVRKKDNTRKEQRRRKMERMALAETQRKEELRHLKNLKKREIKEKIEKIYTVAGIENGGALNLDADDLEEEFDPDEYDRKMKEIFGAEYYEAEDADPEFGSGDEDGIEKPNFSKEDELLGLPKDWDVIGSGEGFKAARERSLKHKNGTDKLEEEEIDGSGEEGDDVVEGDRQREGKRKRKRKMSLREKVELDKELEEYYKLDYEDTIGDLKTRFKYKSVPSNKYHLRTAEILMADEKDLNQYVSLKKLAPYRQDEWKVHKAKRHQMLMKLYNQEAKSDLIKGDKMTCSKSSKSEVMEDKIPNGVSNGEASGNGIPSRRSRRRRRQSELKLSQSRLMAYGKISQVTKKHKKH